MAYWLFKSEPDEFSIDDLQRVGIEPWTGIRNYQARNYLRDSVKPDDIILFYHSSCAVPAIVGLARAVGDAYPDPSQFIADSDYFEPASTPEQPRWLCLDVRYERHLRAPITLDFLKTKAEQFDGLLLLKRGNRLSLFPVDSAHAKQLLALENAA
jgi:predicted RNA-binding protein with PUA-like domain